MFRLRRAVTYFCFAVILFFTVAQSRADTENRPRPVLFIVMNYLIFHSVNYIENKYRGV